MLLWSGVHDIREDPVPMKVLLADDSEVMRRSIRRLLKEYPEIELVAETFNFQQTIQAAKERVPDVILLDLHMPNPENLTLEQIKAACEGCQIIAISVFNDEETKTLAEKLGAAELLDKIDLGEQLVPSIQRLKRGLIWFISIFFERAR